MVSRKSKKTNIELEENREDYLIIALDNGKMNLKAKCGDKELCYRNKYSEGLTDECLGKDTFNVIYEDGKYTIGANGAKSDKNEGKGSKIHIVQALTAITNFIDEEEDREIILIYGESVDLYFNSKHKAEVKEALEGNHSIKVNGKKYKFTIKTVQIMPEGIGHILQDLPKYSGVQYVVDIGGGTINFLTVINGRPEPSRSDSFLLGVNEIVRKIKEHLKREGYGEQYEELILQFIDDKKSCKNKKVYKIIEEHIKQGFVELDNKLSGFVDIHSLLKIQPVLFIGGGSKLFKEQINEHYKSEIIDDVVVEDALLANVRGFHTFGTVKFRQR